MIIESRQIIFMESCLTHIEKDLKPIIMNSARGIMKFGNYHECIQTDGMDYYFIGFGSPDSGDASFAFMGACLPEQCTPEAVKGIVNNILKQAEIPFSVVSASNNHDQAYPYDWVFFFTIFLLVFLITMVLISTFVKEFQKHKIMSAFSLKNSLKIFQLRDNPLNTLNGVRALCMLWVIFGHQYTFIIPFSENILTISDTVKSPFMLFVEAGLFSVDTFFFLGGFLVAYALLKEQSHSFLKYPLAILNRYLRLVPAYLVTILIYSSILIHLGSGPLWNNITQGTNMCNKLWKPLLFIDNLVDDGKTMCLGWGWYLQNDMQIFVYCMLMLLLYQWNKMTGYFAIVWSMLASYLYTMYVIVQNGYRTWVRLQDITAQGDYMTKLYIKPWSRCPPYLLGLLLGMMYVGFLEASKKEDSDHIFLRLKHKMQANRYVRWGFELTGLLLGLFMVLIPRTEQVGDSWPQLAHTLYLTYGKTVFVFSVFLIILPSLLGTQSIIRFIMDTKMFNFVAKVSYCTYLLHLCFIYWWDSQVSTNLYYELIGVYSLFASHSVISVLGGFVLAVLVEIPCAKFQKIIIHKLLGKNDRKQQIHANPEMKLLKIDQKQ